MLGPPEGAIWALNAHGGAQNGFKNGPKTGVFREFFFAPNHSERGPGWFPGPENPNLTGFGGPEGVDWPHTSAVNTPPAVPGGPSGPAAPPIGGFDSTAAQFNPAQVAANTAATPANTFGQTPGSSQITPGIIDKAMAFAKEQPMAAMVLGQAAGGVATGVMDMASGKTAAQTEQLKADAAYRKSIADKTNRDSALQASRIAQMNANLKGLYPQINVSQSAVTLGQQPPTGLIANARG